MRGANAVLDWSIGCGPHDMERGSGVCSGQYWSTGTGTSLRRFLKVCGPLGVQKIKEFEFDLDKVQLRTSVTLDTALRL
jgi:hypothetical protein